jgi:hypothetical protein
VKVYTIGFTGKPPRRFFGFARHWGGVEIAHLG